MTIEKLRENFLKSKQQIQEFYLPSFISNRVSWEEIFSAIDYKYNYPEEKFRNSGDPRFILKEVEGKIIETDILIYNKMDLQVWNVLSGGPDNTVNGENFIPKSKEFTDIFKNVIDDDRWSIKALINLVGNESKYSPHKDVIDVLSWQCLGSVTYRIYEGKDSDEFEVPLDITNRSYKDYVLSPGDVIFLPKGVIHEVISKFPRATLIMNFDLK